ncbi:hypothetical protein EV183_002425 [Coemansia sp. RSA 2336]|nr:hypothetical protein EV183_002425 [Coemansia sp. RSA 2336]
MLVETFSLPCFVQSHDGRALEAEIVLAGSGAHAGTAVVYLHPYPPLGGQLRNNVVQELSASLDRRVALTVAFNLRGAGRSEGRTSWTGAAELEDLRAVLGMLAAGRLLLHPRFHSSADRRSLLAQMHARGFLASAAAAAADAVDQVAIPLPPVSRTLLCGYSYGSMLAAAIAPAEFPRLGIDYALISFPYSVLWALALQRRGWYLQRIAETVAAAAAAKAAGPPALPEHVPRTLFVAGTADNFTSIATYARWWEQLRSKVLQALPPTLSADAAADAADYALTTVRIANADHGWLRRETEVADAIISWWPPLHDASQ